uniref:Ferredoxin thioredoxin reductase alpha chain domain-containing protein n=1 Tax=Tetraselmis chuii TaxID=63592 RepID=A0A7S1SND0_9CHLO|mmetsp:Transcript_21224/g.37812  ORF Transcript_21224/g.37812 Transcript_21224/m.37812 type:complete len:118 (+) Transcript_21224:106-459(+)|eukprot:CAMPEP_0177769380 /NCGR_PEP_ID=MMETSP0491_2-20121128/10285_1 /TAXON_ID=63592 /ORGANISM="Tetraselmis chuii, Strain PLY429" /LENGTH=117 /DNA_ID=CAMNT_0019286373 /DNA_START=96 /DNA_END=449 /DNA_ORIENTATION=+
MSYFSCSTATSRGWAPALGGRRTPAPQRLAGVCRAATLRVSAKIEEGAKVKVTTSVKVYHVPKTPELDLQGMEGVVMADVSTYKGHPISSNLPIKVKFTEPVKVIAHLEESELEEIP